ncbi:sialidase family protein [Niabella aurantiaca]|uniref:sialidase family protein n=1 Tax=Niabella aurantiaca TaxID=379900 RepID=UPI00146D0AD2|nr:sialidase family protein [Niabella aurantiaca]
MRKTICLFLFSLLLAQSDAQTFANVKVRYPYQLLFSTARDKVNQFCIPSLVTTSKGTLIAVVDARIDKPGDAPNNIDLMMRRSVDNGKTWSEIKTIVDFPGKNAAADASMVVDRYTGLIWLAYDRCEANPQGQMGRIITTELIYSKDDGLTWSKPLKLDHLIKNKKFWLQNAPGRGLYTTTGIIVFPMYAIEGEFNYPVRKQTVLVYSTNHGNSWSLSNPVGDNNVEAQIANLMGGKILCNMRRPDGEGYRQVSTTSDLGQTWTPVYTDSVLIDPGCMGSLLDWHTNERALILFSNPADTLMRRNLVLRASKNEGKTWYKTISIHPGWAAYSCMTQLANGNIGMLYEADHRRALLYIEIPYKDLL